VKDVETEGGTVRTPGGGGGGVGGGGGGASPTYHLSINVVVRRKNP